MGTAATIFIGICGGGALLTSAVTFIQFLITRKDKQKDDMKDVKSELAAIRKDIKSLRNEGDRREAENRRVRILRFEDELQDNRRHSKESFHQVLDDISSYNDYCDKHPEFPNERTVATIAHIREIYRVRLDKHDFL